MKMGSGRSFFALVLTISIFQTNLCGSDAGYQAYEWEQLYKLKNIGTYNLASSYARDHTNNDYSWYESSSSQVVLQSWQTVKTIQGPGVITRFWMPSYTVDKNFNMRLYFDNEQSPRIDTDTQTFFSGTFSYFDSSFIFESAGSNTSYEPIFFSDSLTIMMENKQLDSWLDGNLYQFDYIKLPQSYPLSSYNGSLSTEQQSCRQNLQSMMSSLGLHPAGSEPNQQTYQIENWNIDSDNTLDINLDGPGLIRSLYLDANGLSDQQLAELILKVFYDGSQNPAVDVSVADFFAAGFNRPPYRTLYIGTDPVNTSDGFYCHLPMPFEESVLVRLHNTSDGSMSGQSLKVIYTLGPHPQRVCYLNAQTASSTAETFDEDYYHILLETTGTGHYIGGFTYLQQTAFANQPNVSLLEGDDIIIVNGSIQGNGTSIDAAFNGGYAYNRKIEFADQPVSAVKPLGGLVYFNDSSTQGQIGKIVCDQLRWRIADAVPFEKSIEVKLEDIYARNGAVFRSVAFWYELPYLLEDVNTDQNVDIYDLIQISENWLHQQCGNCNNCDLNFDTNVNTFDFALFSDKWGI